MRIADIKRWSLYLGIAFLLVAVVSACSVPGGGRRVWIDDPLDGDRLPVDTVVVYSTSNSSSGVAEITLFVDGDPVLTDEPSGSGDLITHGQPWDPPGPGSYRLQVGMTTGDGESAQSREITVHIGEITPTATLTSTPTPTQEITITVTPSVTPTLTPTFTPSPVPAISINFNADSYSITAGDCTTLRWKVGHAGSVTLDGRAVALEDAREVCPDSSRTYQLNASGAAGEKSAQVSIEVQAPPEPPPPPQNVHISDRTCSSQGYTVTIGWNDTAGNEDGYRVYREGELIAELSADVESYQDDPPGSGPYTYGVEAFNGSGTSQRITVEEEGCLY